MADNVDITPGTGVTVAADEITIGGTPVKLQRVKVAMGKDGTYTGDQAGRNVDGDANASAGFVDPRPLAKRIAVTPVVSVSPAYTAKDAVGALMTFANAARASGGSCLIQSVQIEDKSQQMPLLDLVLFDRAITAPTDNSVFNPSDGDLANCVGVITIPVWSDFSTNSVSSINNVGLEVVLSGSADLFGVLVTRSTPTFVSVGDIVVTLTILQD